MEFLQRVSVMARWDEILSLPVQNPPTLEFGSTDLVWSKVEGYRDNLDRLALIPFARVDDFVRGESNNKECPTRYWCSFGPDDHRKGGIVRPSRTTYVPKNKSAGRPNTKRGCTCHFIVKRLTAEPSVALIIYNQDKHVDKKGLPCHGPQDKKAAGTRAMYAPYISEELRLRVLSLLHVGVSVETIMQRHNESVEKQGGPCNRDDLLTHRYVRRQERSIRRSTYELDEDDAVSISMWVESHQNNVFFYEDFSDSDPFTLGIQTEWQLQQMIQFGNCRLLAYDSKFGSNKLKPCCVQLGQQGYPVAWIITPRFASRDTHRWIRALYNRVRAKDPTWKLAGFILDDPSADIRAIREVFQCSVLICFWRVRHAWHKNLMKRCSNMEMRAEIAKQLGEAVKEICKGPGTADAFEDFMENSVDAAEFVDYFKAIWYPRIGMWARALKTLPLASQETCAAMEFYHAQLKIRLLNEKDQSVYQRADWLVNKLGTKVHSYFWLDEYSGKEDFARYWKDEWMSGPTAWRKSLKIPDAHVVMEGEYAKVIGPKDQGTAHLVLNPGSEYSICDCSWAKNGNLCEHVFKVIKFCRDKGSSTPSMSMFRYSQALINMLHCPPFDSLVRDHAVSLAVWVQMQLNAQICPENRSAEDQTAEPFMGSPDKVVDNTNHCPGKAMSPQLEIPSDDMEVDSSSICTSAPQLFSTDGNTSIGVYVENGTDLMDASTDVEFKNTDGFKNLEKGQLTMIDSPTFDAIIVNGPALSDRMLKADSERSFLLNGTSPLVVECIAAGKYNVPLRCNTATDMHRCNQMPVTLESLSLPSIKMEYHQICLQPTYLVLPAAGTLMLQIMTILTTLGSIKLPNEGDLIRQKDQPTICRARDWEAADAAASVNG
ncbi:hypothetical protein DH2020_030558 [Rehmannia glutinosa]|uniref:SWIM-type domain-containing protein n=1 Tax=Rehmannia glutinosa TaxID=99300 RepID=A0ABR0VLA2_REHGL